MQTAVYENSVAIVSNDDHFLDQIERSIALLGGQHFLRISLFRLEFVGVAASALGSRARQALMNFGLTGLLPDGSLGLLYLGPRARGADDLALERVMAERLNEELARFAPSDARLLSVSATHRWADEIAGAAELIEEAVRPVAMRNRSVRKAS